MLIDAAARAGLGPSEFEARSAKLRYSHNVSFRVLNPLPLDPGAPVGFRPKLMFQRHLVGMFEPHQRFVWLVDADISFVDFNLSPFLMSYQHAFATTGVERPHWHPIIAQPAILGQTQAFWPMNWLRWGVHGDAWVGPSAAIEMDFVEQQAPLLDARFFEWLVRKLQGHPGLGRPLWELQQAMHTDWGVDDLWCDAAKEYVVAVLRQPLQSRAVCAVIGVPIAHGEPCMLSPPGLKKALTLCVLRCFASENTRSIRFLLANAPPTDQASTHVSTTEYPIWFFAAGDKLRRLLKEKIPEWASGIGEQEHLLKAGAWLKYQWMEPQLMSKHIRDLQGLLVERWLDALTAVRSRAASWQDCIDSAAPADKLDAGQTWKDASDVERCLFGTTASHSSLRWYSKRKYRYSTAA